MNVNCVISCHILLSWLSIMRKSTNYVCNNILQIRVFQYYFNEKRKFRPELPCKQVKFSIKYSRPVCRYCVTETLADTHFFAYCHHFAVLQCKRQVETTCPVSTAFCIVVSLVLHCCESSVTMFLRRKTQSSIFKIDMKASLGTLTEPT